VQLKWIIDNMRASIDDFIAAVNKLPVVRRNAMLRAMTQVDDLQATDKRLKALGVKVNKLKELKRVTQLVLKTLQGAEKTAEQMKQSQTKQQEREQSDEAMRNRAIDLQRKGKGQPLEGEVDPNYGKDEKVGAGETASATKANQQTPVSGKLTTLSSKIVLTALRKNRFLLES